MPCGATALLSLKTWVATSRFCRHRLPPNKDSLHAPSAPQLWLFLFMIDNPLYQTSIYTHQSSSRAQIGFRGPLCTELVERPDGRDV